MHLNVQLNLFCAVDFPGVILAATPHTKTVQRYSLSAFSVFLNYYISKFLQIREIMSLSFPFVPKDLLIR